MSNQVIISLDSGTTSCRALAIDQKGTLLGVSQKEFTQIFPSSGWVEHNPKEIWDTQLKVLKELIAKLSIDLDQIIGLGITNQRETTVVWDKSTGEPVYNAIVWQDRRTADICEKMKADGLAGYVSSNTGLVIDAYFSGTKIKWILDRDPKIRKSANDGQLLFGTIDTWLIWNLSKGDSHATDHTNASRTLLYNLNTNDWDSKMMDYLEVPKSMLPTIKNSADHYGFWEYKGVKVPILGVAGDQQSALFGQACFNSGESKNTYGTGCFMLMHTGHQPSFSKSGLLTTMAIDAEGKPAYALEGSIFIAGAAIQWLRDGLKIIDNSEETEQMAIDVEGENSVVVVPAFAGLGTPYWDMYARGAIFGLTRDSSEKHLAKATLQSLAFQTKDVLEAMEKDAGIELKTLKVDGGASRNNYLMQFQSDMLNVPVERPSNVETTAMGAAYLVGIQAGIWKSSSISSHREVDQLFEPEIDVETRDALYKNWQKAIERSKGWLSD